jgi:type IV pilus assembly protein PilY1
VDKNTLNWAAYYGGTDNPRDTKSPLIDGNHPPAITPDSNPCKSTSDNDPGSSSLTGYAFTATDTASLQDALLTAFDAIKNSMYSFSVTSVSSSRTALDNFVYAASFQPKGDPFWPGFITRSTINSDGSLTAGWEGGGILNGNSSRNISTLLGGLITAFQGTAWGTWKDYFGVDTDTAKLIIPYIRGDATPDNWKLGDIFHSSPITIGKPNPYFEDPRDTNKRYYLYRTKSAIQNRAKIIVAGANDGQLHAFNGDTGNEVWSFIPPNLLPKLKYLAHASHPTSLTHQFFVDGPISAADVWVGTGDGTAKGDEEWKTYLVFGEGKGVRDNTGTAGNTSYLWNSSQNCDQNFNPAYVWTSTYKYYCGYHALDITATGSTPAYEWHIYSDASTKAVSSSLGPYLGEPWSKMAIGKVLISGYERWVGFIGGGYGQSGTAGKGFFAVDLKDGHILWSYTNHDNSAMNAIPASPMIVDTDNDGFIDTAYVGDLGGNIWRFTFCTKAQGSSCGTGSGSGNWSGGLIFQPSTTVPIYTAATFARDSNSNLWIFWGAGDKMTPNSRSSSSAGKFFAVKDNSRSGNWTESNLQDITSGLYTADATTKGWYISLGSGGEKMLSDPTVFGGMVLFTTYLPYAGTNPCVSAGTSYLYAVAMQNQPVRGVGMFNTGASLLLDSSGHSTRSLNLGSGIASAPTIAQSSPGTASSLFVSVSGGEGVQGTTATTQATVTKTKVDFDQNSGLIRRLGETGVSTQILHWKDGRIQ